MKKLTILVLLIILTGCTTRSISNSGYDNGGYYGRNGNPLYQGELSEFDVLGVRATDEVPEEEIQKIFENSKKKLSIQKGDSLLVIQSGALIPDSEMIDLLEKYFLVSVFSGVPNKSKEEENSYSQSLRLSAAKAGISKVMVYWGVLESGTTNLVTKNVSWVPIVGWALPDESQRMRIRLKVALIDVLTGQWELFVPKSFDDSSASSMMGRKSSDQDQVAKLKMLSYESAVENMVNRFVP